MIEHLQLSWKSHCRGLVTATAFIAFHQEPSDRRANLISLDTGTYRHNHGNTPLCTHTCIVIHILWKNVHTCKSAHPLRNTHKNTHTQKSVINWILSVWKRYGRREWLTELGPCSKVCVCVHTHSSDPPGGTGGGGNRGEVRWQGRGNKIKIFWQQNASRLNLSVSSLWACAWSCDCAY